MKKVKRSILAIYRILKLLERQFAIRYKRWEYIYLTTKKTILRYITWNKSSQKQSPTLKWTKYNSFTCLTSTNYRRLTYCNISISKKNIMIFGNKYSNSALNYNTKVFLKIGSFFSILSIHWCQTPLRRWCIMR